MREGRECEGGERVVIGDGMFHRIVYTLERGLRAEFRRGFVSS